MKQRKGHTYMNEQPLPSLCCSSALPPFFAFCFVNVESADSSNRQTNNEQKKRALSLCVLCVMFSVPLP